MTWILAIAIGLTFGYIGYKLIPIFMLKVASLNKNDDKTTLELLSYIQLLFSFCIAYSPLFLLMYVFPQSTGMESLLSVLIIFGFIIISVKSTFLKNKGLYWQLIESQDPDINFTNIATLNLKSKNVELNIVISNTVPIKCIISFDELKKIDKTNKDPLIIYNNNQFLILPIVKKRILNGDYDAPRTINISANEIMPNNAFKRDTA